MKATPLREERSGLARVTYGLLAATVAGLAGALLAAIVSPTAGAVCRDDATGVCSLLVGGGAWLLASWVCGIVTALLFRLGPWFILAQGIAGLLVVQLVIQTGWWWAAGLVLLIPVVAAVATDPGVSNARLPRRHARILVVISAVVVIEFVIWAWLTLR